MRIIEELHDTEQIATCPYCHTKIGYIESDTFTNIEGIQVTCPKCGEDFTVKNFDRLAQFPDAYFSFGNGVKIENDEIETWVKQGIKYCIENHTNTWNCSSGDTRVTVDWYDGDNMFDINVSKGYYNFSLDKTDAKALINY